MRRWGDTFLDFDVESEHTTVVRLPTAERIVVPTPPLDWHVPRLFALSAVAHVLFVVAAYIAPAPSRDVVPRRFVFDDPPTRPATFVRSEAAPIVVGGGDPNPTAGVLRDLRVNRRPKPRATTLRDLREALSSPIFANHRIDDALFEATAALRAGSSVAAGLVARRGDTGVESVGIGVLRTSGPWLPPASNGPIHVPVRVDTSDFVCTYPRIDDLRGPLDAARRRFRYCYEKHLVLDPRASGKVVTAFSIGDDGRVSNVRTESSSTMAPTLDRCIVGVVRTLRFERRDGRGTLHVRYPIIFDTAG